MGAACCVSCCPAVDPAHQPCCLPLVVSAYDVPVTGIHAHTAHACQLVPSSSPMSYMQRQVRRSRKQPPHQAVVHVHKTRAGQLYKAYLQVCMCRIHVRVLVPCYKEALELVRQTLRCALDADLPDYTRRTIYLCDDVAFNEISGLATLSTTLAPP